MKKVCIPMLFSFLLFSNVSVAQSRITEIDSLVQVVEKHFNSPNLEGTLFTPEFIEFIFEKKGKVILADEEYQLLMEEFYQRRKPSPNKE